MCHSHLTDRKRPLLDFMPRPIFFKGMAYCVKDRLLLDAGSAIETAHVFLVRDAAKVVVSYTRLGPEIAFAALGSDAQFGLHQAQVDQRQNPLTLTAGRSRNDAKGTVQRDQTHFRLTFATDTFS